MEQQTYRGPAVCHLAGITYRQLDYWARTDLLRPSVTDAQGSGTQRLYSAADVVRARLLRRLLDAGVSLRLAREAVTPLWRRIDLLGPGALEGGFLAIAGDRADLLAGPQELTAYVTRSPAGVLTVVALEGLLEGLEPVAA